MDTAKTELMPAHGLARVALGLNFVMHGYGRLPNLTGFADAIVKQFCPYITSSSAGLYHGVEHRSR